jgi:hypothetical protein
VADLVKPESRLGYLKGGTDPFNESDPLMIETYTLDSRFLSPVSKIEFLRAMVVTLNDEERVQYLVNNVDNGKAYLLGDVVRMDGLSCFMIDSDLSEEQVNSYEGGRIGATLSEWKREYETLRASYMLANNLVASYTWRGIRIWGYIVSYTLSLSATEPSTVLLNLVFMNTREDNWRALTEMEVAGERIPADLTSEGLDMIDWVAEMSPSNVSEYVSAMGKKLSRGRI